MEHEGTSLEAAAERAMARLQAGDGGFIAVSSQGDIVMPFNTKSMFRGAADADGRFEVEIW